MADDFPEVRNNETAQRFESTVDGHLARLDYERRGDVLRLIHTEVPRALEGRGIGGAIVRAALAQAEAAGLRVQPVCSYVRRYIERHPETRRMLADRAASGADTR
jgi:predicted GNAT family acetyltransferase